MTTFIILAALLTLGAAGAIAVPLLRRGSAAEPAAWTAFAVIAVLGVGAASLYVSLSNWSWARAAAAADSPQAMVAKLARRLEHDPNDVEGWLLLGRSYMVLEQAPLATRAYERANALTKGQSPEALLGLAEALSTQDESQLSGRAGQLIEQALALAPRSPKALFFGAEVALRRGNLPLARERFADLLALNPPDSVKPLLQQQIDAIDQRMQGAPVGALPPSASANGSAAAVRVKVALSPKLQIERSSGAPLFVFVRDPHQPGPPLAVKRLETRFPQTVELTAADSMIAGRSISPGQDVEVVARIARTGSPVAQKGDPFGVVGYHVGRDGLVNVVIDRLTP